MSDRKIRTFAEHYAAYHEFLIRETCKTLSVPDHMLERRFSASFCDLLDIELIDEPFPLPGE